MDIWLRHVPVPPARAVRTIFVCALFATGAAAAACGGSSSTPTPGRPSQSSAATSTPVVQPSESASAAPPLPDANDIATAQQSALGLFIKLPTQPDNPSTTYVWRSGQQSLTHLAPAVRDRLSALGNQGYFRDQAGACGEDYITHTQNGLYTEPTVSSTTPAADGSVTVVIRRAPDIPNLTAIMKNETGAWLATDLQSGTGPNASIFAAQPNC
jgi:hypothetical protein